MKVSALIISIFLIITGCSSSDSNKKDGSQGDSPILDPGTIRMNKGNGLETAQCEAQYDNHGNFIISATFNSSQTYSLNLTITLKERPGINQFVLDSLDGNQASLKNSDGEFVTQENSQGTLKISEFKNVEKYISGEFEFEAQQIKTGQLLQVTKGEFLKCPVVEKINAADVVEALNNHSEVTVNLKARMMMNDKRVVECDSSDGRCSLVLLTILPSMEKKIVFRENYVEDVFHKNLNFPDLSVSNSGQLKINYDLNNFSISNLRSNSVNQVYTSKSQAKVLTKTEVKFELVSLPFIRENQFFAVHLKGLDVKSKFKILEFSVKTEDDYRALETVDWESAELDLFIRNTN